MTKYHRRRRRESLAQQLRDRAQELQLAAPDTKSPPRQQRRAWSIAITSTDTAEVDAMATWRSENGLPP